MAYTGSVSRWFNRKGYGFIKVLTPGNEHTGEDFFVHLSGINSPNDGYKSLYPGEYVSFDLDKGGDGRYNCVNLTGVLGGPLLVEHPVFRYSCRHRIRRELSNNIQDEGEGVHEDIHEDKNIDEEENNVNENNVDENDPEQ